MGGAGPENILYPKMIGKYHFSKSMAAVASCRAERGERWEREREHAGCSLTTNEGENVLPARVSHTGFIEHLWPESLPHAGLTITKPHDMAVQELPRSGNERGTNPERESQSPEEERGQYLMKRNLVCQGRRLNWRSCLAAKH